MLRTFMAKFTPTHFVALAISAMFAPTVVYGVAAYQNVSIEDVTSGAHVQVDPANRLQIVEAATLPIRNPYNYIKFSALSCGNSSNVTIYTVPAGKILVIKHISMVGYNGTSGGDNWGYIVDADGSGTIVAGLEHPNTAASQSTDVEHYVRTSIRWACGPTGTFLAALDGFLIPASVLPPAAQAQAEGQEVRGAALMKNGRRL